MKNANKTTRDMECNHIIQCVGVFMLLLGLAGCGGERKRRRW